MNPRMNESDTAQQRHHRNIATPVALMAGIVLGVIAARKLLHSHEYDVTPPKAVGSAVRHRSGLQPDRLPNLDAQMRYYIGEHDGIKHPFDRNTYRAYFYWRELGVPHIQSFSVEQLEELIAERKTRGISTEKIELAMAHLQRMNNVTPRIGSQTSW